MEDWKERKSPYRTLKTWEMAVVRRLDRTEMKLKRI